MSQTDSHLPTYPVHSTDILAFGFPPRLKLFDHDGVMSIRPSGFWFLLTTFVLFLFVFAVYFIAHKLLHQSRGLAVAAAVFVSGLAFMLNLGPFYSALGISPILKLDAKTRRLSWHAGARLISIDEVESFEVFTGVYQHRFQLSNLQRDQPNISRYVQWSIRTLTGERQVVWHSHMRSKHNANILREFALAAAIPIESFKVDIFEDETKPIGQRVTFFTHA